MSIRRRKYRQRVAPKRAMPDFAALHAGQQLASASGNLSDAERQTRREEQEWDRLEIFRKKLVAGETKIVATAPHLGGTVSGTFQKLEGYRIKFTDDATQVIYTCKPSEVYVRLI